MPPVDNRLKHEADRGVAQLGRASRHLSMVYVYILHSEKDGSYYIGQTKNVSDRLYRHNSGQSISTKSKIPWEIVYIEKFDSRVDAVRRERQLKKEKSKEYIERLIKRGIAQFGLARDVRDVEVVSSNLTPPI